MRYSLFAGGKRLRPALVAAGAECCGGRAARVLKAGAALEMIHTYSLIHDDLPAMDDDDLRRGKPTSHKVFGEALAILAGDGLLTLAFETAAANARECGLGAADTSEFIRVIAAGAGTSGMVGGQVADLGAEKWKGRLSRAKAGRLLEYIHLHKTGALITASLEAGAILAKASAAQRRALRAYGRAIGLSFQIADDILDLVGDKDKLGKRGSDAANQKLTYVSLYGLERARAEAASLTRRAHRALAPFGARAAVLHELADYIVTRDR
ncbi:MAG: polyprenyl synthetase family protein [Elusimicrobia bacterium]|nr:polyprenyl synthetase family protein [Elusimicrobiota bacterium]